MGDTRSPEVNREVKWFRKRWREGRAAFFSFCIQSSPVSLPLNCGKQELPWLLGNALTYCADVLSSLVLMYPCWFKSNHLPAFLCELVRSPETSSVWLSSCSSPAHSPMVISSGNKPVDSPLQKTSSCNPSKRTTSVLISVSFPSELLSSDLERSSASSS